MEHHGKWCIRRLIPSLVIATVCLLALSGIAMAGGESAVHQNGGQQKEALESPSGSPESCCIEFSMGVSDHTAAAEDAPIVFDDILKQTAEFIRYQASIALTPEQEAVKREALSRLPAPCCSNDSAETCCCVCNMARATWGLSKFLITQYGYDATQVRETVTRWFDTINPDGFSGNACYTKGGCERPFGKDGCGGMGASFSL